MSTTGTEKHCRLCLMLTRGGTKACHYLLLKRIEELSPKDHQPYPWTVQQFLDHKKKTIQKPKISKDKLNVLFPVTGETDLSKWDLSLYCTVLMVYCQLSSLDDLDIKQFQTLRNELCHMNEPNVTDPEFKDKLEIIQVVIGRILQKIGNPTLTTDIENIMKSLETEPLSLVETLKEMHRFYLMEIDIREKLEHVEEILLNKMEQLDDKCELISKKVDQNSSANMVMARNNVLVPGVDIFLDLKNISDDEEENMSAVLCQLFEEVINEDDDFKSNIPADSHVKLREVSRKTFHLFLSKGWKIVSAKHECIQLHIKCDSFKSLAGLFREQTHGQLGELLTDLKEALNECVVERELCIETIIYKDEFWNVLEESIFSVDEYLTKCTVGSSSPNDNGHQCPEARRPTLTLSVRNVRADCDQTDCSSELESCLQCFKTDLQSEFAVQNIPISWSNASSHNVNVDIPNMDRNNEDKIEESGSEKVALTQTIDKLHNLSLTNKDYQEQLDREAKEGSGENYNKNKSTEEIESKMVKDVENEGNKSTEKTGKSPSLVTTDGASKYSKEDSTIDVGKVMEQSAMDGITDSSIAVVYYLELASLTLFESDLQRKVYDTIEETRCVDVDGLVIYLEILAKEMKTFNRYISATNTMQRCEEEIEKLSRNIQKERLRVKEIITKLESIAKMWKSTTHLSKEESRESYDQLKNLCSDEELNTNELESELKLLLYRTDKSQTVQAWSSTRTSFRKLFSKHDCGDEYEEADDTVKKRFEVSEVPSKTERISKPHSMHDISKHEDKEAISVKPSYVDVRTSKETKDKTLEILSQMLRPGPALLGGISEQLEDKPKYKPLFSVPDFLEQPKWKQENIKPSSVKLLDDLTDIEAEYKPFEKLEMLRSRRPLLGDSSESKCEDKEIHKTLLTDPHLSKQDKSKHEDVKPGSVRQSRIDILTVQETKFLSDEWLEESDFISVRPLFGDYEDKQIHKSLFSDPQFLESNSEFLEEVKAFHSELIKQKKGAMNWTDSLQQQGVQVSHRCMQRVVLHLDIIDVQLIRLSNTLSRIKTALEKIREHDVLYMYELQEDFRQEWNRVERKCKRYDELWLFRRHMLLELENMESKYREERLRIILQE